MLLYLALGGWVNWGLTFSEEQALHKMSIKSTVGESSTATMDVLHTAKRALLEVKLNTAIDEMYKQWSILLSFIIGAIIGGAIALQISFWSISISVFLCLFLCIEGYWQLVFNSKIQKDGIKANKSQCSAPVDAPVLESLSNGKGSLISPTTNDINTISNMSKDEKETEMVGMNASNIAIAIGNCDKIDEHKSSSQTSDILCDESRPLSTTLLSTALLSTSTDTRNNEVTSSPVPLSLYIEPPQSSQSPTRGYDSSGKNKEYRTGNSDNSSVRNEDDKDIFGVASFSSISASHRMKLSRLLKSLRPSEYNALVQSLILNRDHKRRESNVNKNNGLVLQSNQNSNEQSPISSSNRANSLAVLNADSMIIDETVLECLQNGQGSSITKPRSGSMSAYNSLSPAMQSAVMQSHNIQKIYNNADLDYNI